MRVIAGEFKGRRLATVKGLATRPILDRVKESLFGMLAETVMGARVLDVFCGAGTIAIEALSRGAVSAVMVDISRGASIVAQKNIAMLDLHSRVEFIGGDALRAVRKLAERGTRFDLIFIDPPYFSGLALPALAAIRDGGILAEGGMAIVRHHKKEPVGEGVQGWQMDRQRQIGEGILTFFTLPGQRAAATMT